jgi:hypothetical protein
MITFVKDLVTALLVTISYPVICYINATIAEKKRGSDDND